MNEESLLEYYKEALDLKRQLDTLSSRKKEYIEQGVRVGYLKNSTNSLEGLIEQCKEGLKSELGEMINNENFIGIKKVADALANIRDIPIEKIRKKELTSLKEDDEKVLHISYSSKLPSEVYEEAENFGDLIEKARKYRNTNNEGKILTWKRLGKQTGISMTYISMIRKGKNPSKKVIRKISDLLGGESERFLEIAGK